MTPPSAVRQSFVEGSNDSCFSMHNLPYGVFYHAHATHPHVGVAIGDFVLDLTALEAQGVLRIASDRLCFDQGSLNAFAAMGSVCWSFVRRRLQALLAFDNDELQGHSALLHDVLIPKQNVTMTLPFKTEGFTDFYASEHHATNVGRLFRGNANALLPNWKHLPVGYHGRASTLMTSGASIHRPKGLIQLSGQDNPIFSASRKLDFELEMGVFVGVGNPDGRRISVHDAYQHLFGLVLLNDWSARDVQAFEYQPLGPFLSKSFATSISPWVVPLEALRDARVSLPKQVPMPCDYLYQDDRKQFDIQLHVDIQPKGSSKRTRLCTTNCKELYWSMEQMLAHHTVNHCVMKSGDLLGTGTISGSDRTSWGSLLELSFNGAEPVKLQDGHERCFLEDGDMIIMSGFCQVGTHQLGFGTLEGTIVAAVN